MSLNPIQKRTFAANILGILTCILAPTLYIVSAYQAYQTGSRVMFGITIIPFLGQIVWLGASCRTRGWGFITLFVITGLIAKIASDQYEKVDKMKLELLEQMEQEQKGVDELDSRRS
jgi:FtsH-binding integral membrane protein